MKTEFSDANNMAHKAQHTIHVFGRHSKLFKKAKKVNERFFMQSFQLPFFHILAVFHFNFNPKIQKNKVLKI